MSKDQTAYTTGKLKQFKKSLTANLKEVNEELDQLRSYQKKQKNRRADSNPDFNESSKHFQQQAKNDRQKRRLQRRVRELKSALRRVEDGTYGVDERTGKLIREERLKAMPTARFDILPRKK